MGAGAAGAAGAASGGATSEGGWVQGFGIFGSGFRKMHNLRVVFELSGFYCTPVPASCGLRGDSAEGLAAAFGVGKGRRVVKFA